MRFTVKNSSRSDLALSEFFFPPISGVFDFSQPKFPFAASVEF
jgi:hypothetical protein